MDNGQWTMDNGQLMIHNEQWTMEWTMDNGQWTMDGTTPWFIGKMQSEQTFFSSLLSRL